MRIWEWIGGIEGVGAAHVGIRRWRGLIREWWRQNIGLQYLDPLGRVMQRRRLACQVEI